MKMMRREALLALLPLARLWPRDYLLSTIANDGSLYHTGYVNGYRLESWLKVDSDHQAVLRFEVSVIARSAVSVKALLDKLGYVPAYKTTFSTVSLLGQPLLIRFGDVQADFHVLVNGVLFQDAGITKKQLVPGNVVKLVAVASAKLVAA